MVEKQTVGNPISIFRRILTFFNILPGEQRLVGLLTLLYCSMAFGFVFVQSMAFGVFLAQYGSQGLPYSYISIAILASLVAWLYIKLGDRVSFSILLYLNLAFLGIASLLIWLGLNSPFSHQTAFFLPLWFQIVANLGNLAVWSLAARLFNIGQVKRLFPLLGAGLWVGNIIGGLLVPLVVGSMGANNLLLLATASFGVSLLILRSLSRSYLQKPSLPAPARRRTPASRQPGGLFKDRYVLLIFASILLWWVAFFFVDNIFYSRAAVRYPGADQLTNFMGQFLSIIGVIALISTTLLTSRIIKRFGLRVGLLGMPVVVILSIAILAFSRSFGMPLLLVFLLATFAKAINVAFGFSLSQSSNAIVYQSLPDTIRPRVQATAETMVQPIAIGLAGISLLALTTGLKLDYIGLSFVFLVLGAAWVTTIVFLSGNYMQALSQVIARRHLGDSPSLIADPGSISLLRERLHDPHPAVAIYALNRLETLDRQTLIDELPELVGHVAPEMRQEAFSRVETLKLQSALQAVRDQLVVEKLPSVREAALRALGAIANPDICCELAEALEQTEPGSLRGALIGLLKAGPASSADDRFQRLCRSGSVDDRILAAQILGEVQRPSLLAAHQALLRDPDLRVRQAALESAGKVRQSALLPLILEACDDPTTSRLAGIALASIGPEALPGIESAFCQPAARRHRLLTLAKTLGFIQSAHAQSLLLSRLDAPDNELRSSILNALNQNGYRAKDDPQFEQSLRREVEQAAWNCAAQVDLGQAGETALLLSALKNEFTQARDRILLLLSFVFDPISLRRVREALNSGFPAQHSYALEILEIQLPGTLKQVVMPLLEHLSPVERLQRLAGLFPQQQLGLKNRLEAIIRNEQFNGWVCTCALATAARLYPQFYQGEAAMLSTVEKVLILKSVDMFGQTPDHVLADVAELLEEIDVPAGETILQQGDFGDSMYVIVDGKVSVCDGERLLNYLGERDVFGEMALLDPEPRLATVIAEQPTRLFPPGPGSILRADHRAS